MQAGGVDELFPADAYAALEQDPDTALVDVRTRPEWTFVGIPDLGAIGRRMALVEWAQFPSMTVNPNFLPELTHALGGSLPGRVFFICRSGARSLAAARLVAEETARGGRAIGCINVKEGFEGDLDAEGHRGSLGGWKRAGLPWRQN